MIGIENTNEFQIVQQKFKSKFLKNKKCEEVKDCDWSIFKSIFLEFSNYKCPICETQLGSYSSDIDHFRPQSKYDFLECCCRNYMIMCPDCNRGYKRAKFPISFEKEDKLLINPREDDIYHYFEIAFIKSINGKNMLILQANHNLNQNDMQKAKETIKMYGLGDCNPNSNMEHCRVKLLNEHYFIFYKLAKELDNILIDLENKFEDDWETIDEEFEKYCLIELDKRDSPELLKEYGFLEFIKRQQFIVVKYD